MFSQEPGAGDLHDVDPRTSADWCAMSMFTDDAEAALNMEASLLHSLLESLPEPPVTAVKRLGAPSSALASLTALADSLPAPPSSTTFSASMRSANAKIKEPPSARPPSPPHSPAQPQFTLSAFQFDDASGTVAATTSAPETNELLATAMPYPEVKSRQLRTLRPVSGAAFGYASNDYDGGYDYSSEDDLAAVRPPSALFYSDPVVELPVVLDTPAPSRRNTEDDSATSSVAPPSWGYHRERLRRLPSLEPLLLPLTVPIASEESFLVGRTFSARGDTTPPPLGSEMPPVSPFFARIRPSDIEDVRETVKRASISRRRNTLAGSSEQRSSWSSPSCEQSFASLRLSTATTTPTRASLAGTLAGWQPSSTGRWSSFYPVPESRQANRSESLSSIDSADDWLINQEPPISPLFADENRLAAERRKSVSIAESLLSSSTCRPEEDVKVPERSTRWYKVDVHSLFSSPLAAMSGRPRVAITDLSDSSKPADPNDPDVQRALRRYPLALALSSRQQKRQSPAVTPTRIRVPSQRQPSPTAPVLSVPTLSFTISTDGTSDRPVRSVDVEAMAAAYLPHVHALLNDPDACSAALLVDGAPSANGSLRTPSESSTATLTDGFHSEAPKEQSKTAPRSLLRRLPRRSDIGPMAMIPLKSDTPSNTFPMPRQQLRASASVMNLRGAYSERSASLPLPPTPLSAGARRSTLATRAVPQPPLTPAAPANSRHSIMRRNSAMELNASRTQPPPSRRIQPQHQPPPALPSPSSFASGDVQKLRPSMSLQHSLGFGMAETPTASRSGASSGLRTPTSLISLPQKPQFQTGSTRGRLQTYGEAMPVSLMPMRSASLEITATNDSVCSMSTSSCSSRTPRIAGSMQTPLSLRKPAASPSTTSLFGRRRGTSTAATVTLGSAVTPTAPRTFASASRILKLSRPPPMPANGLLANGPKSAPVPAFVPESFSSLPPFPKRTPVSRSRPDVRNMFGYVDDSQPLPRLPPRLPPAASNPVDMYRGLSSALPMLRVSSRRNPE
ncbi:hypothetical protein GGI19_000574 [Coemansia pectinata]|uniref:Uncharacterized protein n=1 Tax=Coemansia pectinata TaxID=1052879 RepID=A0A9W8LE15_9FUNG|nr:hypothetical protein GGI19_000574 [Coemansia pectinata]